MRVQPRIKAGTYTVVETDTPGVWQVFAHGAKKPVRTFSTKRGALGAAQAWAWREALGREVRVTAGST
jgi:hypothetical protein